jgi:type II secretory pathway pseudopilin PulG
MSESGGGKSGVNVGAVVVVVIVVGVIIAAIGINNQQQSPKNEAEKVLKESVEKVKDATKDGLGEAKKKLEAAGGGN